jgi:hypothetical protein
MVYADLERAGPGLMRIVEDGNAGGIIVKPGVRCGVCGKVLLPCAVWLILSYAGVWRGLHTLSHSHSSVKGVRMPSPATARQPRPGLEQRPTPWLGASRMLP